MSKDVKGQVKSFLAEINERIEKGTLDHRAVSQVCYHIVCTELAKLNRSQVKGNLELMKNTIKTLKKGTG